MSLHLFDIVSTMWGRLMAGFDIIGSNPYGGQLGGDGFDLLGSAPGRGLIGQLGPQQGMAQQQSAPVSGLVAGALGLPTYGGAVPGASYLTPSQGMQPQQAQRLLQMMQAAGYQIGGPAAAAQLQNNIGSAVGSGARSLFDALVNGGR